jgi:hypothetical protein
MAMHPQLAEGLTDAIGFVAGALLAWWIGRMLGFDPMAAGHDTNVLGGILLAGLGGGGGVQIARRVRAARRRQQ